jgi:hypothetical protein
LGEVRGWGCLPSSWGRQSAFRVRSRPRQRGNGRAWSGRRAWDVAWDVSGTTKKRLGRRRSGGQSGEGLPCQRAGRRDRPCQTRRRSQSRLRLRRRRGWGKSEGPAFRRQRPGRGDRWQGGVRGGSGGGCWPASCSGERWRRRECWRLLRAETEQPRLDDSGARDWGINSMRLGSTRGMVSRACDRLR